MNPEVQTPPSKASSLFEQQVDATFESLPDTSPVEERPAEAGLLDKLGRIAAQEGFEVERLLGQGGMGAVVSARDRELGRLVALKFLVRPGMERRSSERLKREAERAGSLVHENVVPVYSWHSVGNLVFFSMEYVDGETLYDFLQRHKHATPAQILRIVAEAAAGVAAAHDAGILHRDIKPQNLLIARNGRVKVTDFGLAADVKESLRGGGSLVVSGTVGFMAPEQARGEEETFAADVFSLVATLYYALTGRLPFASDGEQKNLLRANQEGRIVPLYTIREDLPQPVYRLVARGLNLDPSRRYPTARALRAEMEAVLLNLDVGTGLRGHLGDWRIRIRRHAFLLGLLLGLACGAAGMWFWLGMR